MNHDWLEKQIVNELQGYTSPDPDPAFAAKLKEQFLQRAREAQRKRKLFQGAAWAGAVAASLLVGFYVYDQWIAGLDQNHLATIPEADQKELMLMQNESEQWKPIDVSNMEEAYSEKPLSGELRVYTDSSEKKLIAVKSGQGRVLFESADRLVKGAKVYQFPDQPYQYYVWFLEVKPSENPDESKLINHLLLVKEDGSFQEVGNIPQAGFNTTERIEWSPSGKKAFLALENAEEWIVGELDAQNVIFKPLYGQITKELKPNLDKPDLEHKPWQVTWMSETALLVYNPMAHAFYGVNLDNQSAWEIKTVLPRFSEGYYIKKVIVPEGNERLAFVQVGRVIHDIGFSGTEQVYLLDMQENVFIPVPVANGLKGWKFDQRMIAALPEENLLFGTVLTPDPNGTQYIMQLSRFNSAIRNFDMVFEKAFKESIYINPDIKFSKDGKYIAVKIHWLPREAVAREYLVVINLETGKEAMEPVVKENIVYFDFGHDGSIKVDGQLFEILEK